MVADRTFLLFSLYDFPFVPVSFLRSLLSFFPPFRGRIGVTSSKYRLETVDRDHSFNYTESHCPASLSIVAPSIRLFFLFSSSTFPPLTLHSLVLSVHDALSSVLY